MGTCWFDEPRIHFIVFNSYLRKRTLLDWCDGFSLFFFFFFLSQYFVFEPEWTSSFKSDLMIDITEFHSLIPVFSGFDLHSRSQLYEIGKFCVLIFSINLSIDVDQIWSAAMVCLLKFIWNLWAQLMFRGENFGDFYKIFHLIVACFQTLISQFLSKLVSWSMPLVPSGWCIVNDFEPYSRSQGYKNSRTSFCCKRIWNTHTFATIDYVKEMTAKKFCKYDSYKSFEQLFYLFFSLCSLLCSSIRI